MLKLAKSTNEKETDTALGSNEQTRSFTINSGYAVLTLTGDFSAQTATVQMSPTRKAADFASYIVKDATGTPGALAFTDDESVLIVGPGQTFRVVTSTGGTPDIDVFVDGDDISLN
jgi:hypothetical protein